MEIFAKIVKAGLTFETVRGNQTPQTLWQMPLTGNNDFNLDTTSKILLAKTRSTQEDSLVSDSKVSPNDELRIEVLKFIIADKQSEIKAKEDSLVAKQHNDKIDALIAQKKDTEMQELSIEELEKLRK
ncbi:coil containing protein [Vibrio phage 1.101.O._10N.261.45.C6]|nr:coil containing protein [Vibrio phage 1.101.O._10N.261.45.C6]